MGQTLSGCLNLRSTLDEVTARNGAVVRVRALDSRNATAQQLAESFDKS